jgi:hypothetical protein
MIEQPAQTIAKSLVAKKEELIKNAITHMIGHDRWTIDEIKDRGQFVIIQNKTETFTFDGVELLQFSIGPDFNYTVSKDGLTYKASMQYKKLY